MGIINDVGGIWSRSGSDSGNIIDKVLGIGEKVMDTVNQVVNIFTSAKEHKNVISDYRKASVHLPKYYKEEGLERVATIEVIDAVDVGVRPDKSKQTLHQYTQDLIDRKTKDTFIIKNIQEPFVERYQVVETFGEGFAVFLSGERPKIFTYSGILINDAYRGWKSHFVAAYSTLLRGSKLAQKKLKVKLVYDYIEAEGYVLELATNTESSNDVDVSFTLQVLITGYSDLGIDKFSEAPTYGGQLGWPLGSTALSRLAAEALIRFIPSLAGSGYEPYIIGAVDDLLGAFLPKGINDNISGWLGKGGDILGTATKSVGAISGILGEAFGAKAATSAEKAPNTASLLSMTSKAVSGGFSAITSKITSVTQQFSGYRQKVTDGLGAITEKFKGTTNIVNTTLLPKVVNLSEEAESAIGNVVSMEEAGRLLEQTGQGYLAKIPHMTALSMGDSPDSPFHIDYQQLNDVFLSEGGKVRENVQKSYDEVVGMVGTPNVGDMQGIKQLTEYKNKLTESVNALGEGGEYPVVAETSRLYTGYLQTAYILMGRQH